MIPLRFIFIVFLLLIFFGFSMLFCNAAERHIDYEKLEKRISEVSEWVAVKDYANLSRLADYINREISDDPDAYVTTVWKYLKRFERRLDEKTYPIYDEMSQKAINMDVNDLPYRLGQQIDLIGNRYLVAIGYSDERTLTKQRRQMSQKLLSNWQQILSFIDDLWDEQNFDPRSMVEIPNDPELWLGASVGPYTFLHLSPERFKNQETQKKYVKQVKEAKSKIKQANIQREAKKVRFEKKDGQVIKDFLIAVYSLQPFATSELEQLLKDQKVDEVFAKEVLDAVRKTEKEVPPMTEFRDWETSDKLFKAKAKFVSSNGKTVTLEKENGKQMTLNLEDLRWSDKNIVNEKLKEKIKP
jgi:hypothetical protein